MASETIVALASFIEKIGFERALIVSIIFGLSWFCARLIKTNSQNNLEIKNELDELKIEQRKCHKDREAQKSELIRITGLNEELSRVNLATQEHLMSFQKTFISAIKSLNNHVK